MPTELICLLILALWGLVLNHLPALTRYASGGLEWAISNRETTPEVPAWVGRADRAQRNHHDNLAMIASILLISVMLQKTDAITQTSAIVILAARIAHAIFYWIGIGWLRSLSYAVSVLGVFAIVWRLIA